MPWSSAVATLTPSTCHGRGARVEPCRQTGAPCSSIRNAGRPSVGTVTRPLTPAGSVTFSVNASAVRSQLTAMHPCAVLIDPSARVSSSCRRGLMRTPSSPAGAPREPSSGTSIPSSGSERASGPVGEVRI